MVHGAWCMVQGAWRMVHAHLYTGRVLMQPNELLHLRGCRHPRSGAHHADTAYLWCTAHTAHSIRLMRVFVLRGVLCCVLHALSLGAVLHRFVVLVSWLESH
jgi:hypothetical protein